MSQPRDNFNANAVPRRRTQPISRRSPAAAAGKADTLELGRGFRETPKLGRRSALKIALK